MLLHHHPDHSSLHRQVERQPCVPSGTPTGQPGNTRLSFSLYLHGMGKGGDNVNATTTYGAPRTTQRQVRVAVFNQNNHSQGVKQGTVTCASATGNFSGTVDIGNVPSGLYTFRIKVPG